MSRDTTVPVRVGQVLAGKYRVERLLGAGGMGVVVAARHLRLADQPVAIKFLQRSALSNRDAVERFQREAHAMSLLRSDHVVRVNDVDALPDGTPYMVMEYLQGEDLGAVLRQWPRLAVGDAVAFVLQACEAVAEAHANGIVHRDIKPQNLFLTTAVDGSPRVKVLDFGISKMGGTAEPALSLTESNAVMGSPLYMSPEQLRSTRSADARSDIWALGAVLYELLTGQPPYNAESAPALYAKMLEERPAPPHTLRPDMPVDLSHVVLRCLERDPGARFQSAAELASALEPFGPAHMSGVGQRIGALRALATTPPADVSRAHGAGVPHDAVTRVADGGLLGVGTGVAWDASERSMRRRSRLALYAALIGAGVGLVGVVAVVIVTQLGRSRAAAEAPAAAEGSQVGSEAGPTATATATPPPTPTPTSTPTATAATTSIAGAAPAATSSARHAAAPRATASAKPASPDSLLNSRKIGF